MRWTQKFAAAAAKRFAASRQAEHWHLFGAPIRTCLIDAHVMFEVQTADSADSELTFTASNLVEFRRMLVAELAAGVKVHSRSMAVRFTVD